MPTLQLFHVGCQDFYVVYCLRFYVMCTDDLTELKYKVLNVLLQYCMENVQDGWKAWVKVASWLHAHVRVCTYAQVYIYADLLHA